MQVRLVLDLSPMAPYAMVCASIPLRQGVMHIGMQA
jgi:hypothetical protein